MAFRNSAIPAILKTISGAILLLALAGIFIFSGWTKLQTIEPFAWSFIDILPVSITTATVIAHLAIGLEWLIGAWLLAHIYLRQVTYKATIVLLLLFILYLLGLIFVQGNNGNCGCFGEWLYMKPGAAILKNLAMVAGVVLLWFIYPSRTYSNQLYVALFLAVAAFTAPFIIDPIRIHGSGEKLSEAVDLGPLYEYGSPPPSLDLKQGKHIICFFSTTCPHCKKGAYLLQILHRRYPELPLFMALNGTEPLKKSFLAETKSGAVPQTLLSNTPAFSSMAGQYVPAIYWINNSIIERKTYYTELEPGAIKAWLREK